VRCALYVRAATRTECDTQLLELRAYVERRGWPPAVEYIDVGISRPQLAELMGDARSHKFEMVLVWRLDRWGRDLANCLASIQDLLRRGIGWAAVSQSVSAADIKHSLLAALTAYSQETKSERIKASMRRAERRTFISSGRPKKVFDREKLFALRDAGKSIRVIAAELKIGRGTVQRLLLPARTGE